MIITSDMVGKLLKGFKEYDDEDLGMFDYATVRIPMGELQRLLFILKEIDDKGSFAVDIRETVKPQNDKGPYGACRQEAVEREWNTIP